MKLSINKPSPEVESESQDTAALLTGLTDAPEESDGTSEVNPDDEITEKVVAESAYEVQLVLGETLKEEDIVFVNKEAYKVLNLCSEANSGDLRNLRTGKFINFSANGTYEKIVIPEQNEGKE